MSSDRGKHGAQKGTAALLALWLAVVGSMAMWITAQRATDHVRNTWHDTYPLLFLPTGKYLAAASLGFRTVLADVIYLWSIQYYGHHRTLEGRSHLRRIYNVITDLDPEFTDAYTTGALVMAQDMADPQMAIELLDRGIERNPDNWVLPWDAGWYMYMDLEDYETAERYYALAAEKPDAPSWVARLRAHMVVEQGDLLSAILLWEQIRDEAEAEGDEEAAAIAAQRVPDLYARYAIGEIEAAIARFEEDQGRRPDSLALLASLGLLPEMLFLDAEGRPLNYLDEPFNYDPADGRVTDPSAEKARTSR
jgi:tetratricopeptide (TPR) repeat protein